MVFNATFNNF